MKKYLILVLFLVFGCGQISYNIENSDGKLEHKTKWKVIEIDFNRLYRRSELERMNEEIKRLKEILLEMKNQYEHN